MTIERKTIRDFMQKEMRERLFGETRISRRELCGSYAEFTDRDGDDLSLDERIEFINTIQELCRGHVIFRVSSYGAYEADFLVDPAETQDWERFMDSIYTEA